MAFGGFDKGSSAPMAEINTTPLVDVMLVLLVVFIITAPVLSHAIKVDLPQATASEHKEDVKAIRFTIDAEGKYFWNDEPVAETTLATRFADAARSNPLVELHLRADQTAHYGPVARVLAQAQKNGVTRIGFVTEVPAKPQ